MRYILFILLGAVLLPRLAFAHPHAWIGLRTIVIVNEQGEAVALREHWLFDKTYSAFAAQDFKRGKKFTEADLLPLAKENLKNLKAFSYFTVLESLQGKTIKFAEPKDITSVFEGAQIAMEFTLPLAVPLAVQGATYRIYDPTYYVDMAHEKDRAVSFQRENGESPATCQGKVELPKVDEAMIFNASALDKNATAPKDLGYHFAEKVTLSCSQQK